MDVTEDAYYYDAVLWAVAEEITTGTSPTTFSPEDDCTRAQVVAFLWRSAGKPEPETEECPFTDVNADDYFYKAVLWAVEEGITTGTSETTFSPDAPCTRAHVVTFLWRSRGEPVPETEKNPFADVSGEAYYRDAVVWAVENEITNGVAEGVFAPDRACTRGQIVTFLHRSK